MVLFWVFCGIILLLTVLTVKRDEEEVQRRVSTGYNIRVERKLYRSAEYWHTGGIINISSIFYVSYKFKCFSFLGVDLLLNSYSDQWLLTSMRCYFSNSHNVLGPRSDPCP